MRGLKKGISAVVAAALFLTALPVNGSGQAFAAGNQADEAADVSVSIQPEIASKFNDTDGDGWGEFEGWGTSLCWWANRLGYSQELTTQAADKFFSENGLNMNIGRYNVGGGDLVYEPEPVRPNEKAQVYEVEGSTAPQYGGSKMKVETNDKLKSTAYKISDADFGFAKGDTVGVLKHISWVNELGAANGDGGNLHYTVNVGQAGKYTIKMLWSLDGDNKRAAAIRLNSAVSDGDASNDMVVSAADVNKNEIASANGNHLYLVTFSNVQLNAGNNLVAIGGNTAQSLDGKEAWGMNFVKMLVVKSGDEGQLPQAPEEEFIHPSHIKRSDSVVPGYCTEVTKITDEHPLSWYEENFDRADAECGYAWNYDWNADENQVNIIKAAIAANDEFLAEAFSNSPPYFMTNSGCSSGAEDSSKDNLRADSYHAFAAYMADVIEYWAGQGIEFQSTTAMNEPDTSYWGANSNKQEGCHFDPGNSQSKIIVALHNELAAKAQKAADPKVKNILENIIISGTDETDIDKAISSYKALSSAAKEIVTRIDTHTYDGSKRAQLCDLAEQEGKNLWMSEVDGAYTAGSSAGEMTAALGLAGRIMTDLRGLKSSAWILWNAVDMHVDADEERDGGFDADTLEELYKSKDQGGKGVDLNQGYWGIAIGDHNSQEIVLTKKYEAFGQFSRYIRPGYTIIGSDNGNTLAAWDRKGKKLVIVAMNVTANDQNWKFDLSKFTEINETNFSKISAYRTSGSMKDGEKWADVSNQVNAAANAQDQYVTADMKANSITTFIIQGVEEYDDSQNYTAAEEKVKQEILKEDEKEIEKNMEEISLNSDMVTGTTPWTNDKGEVSSNVATFVVDGKLDTFFDGVSDGWVKIDLGKAETIAAAAYAPRSGYADRCVGASFYGSNDGENWERLYTISETPASGKYSYAYANRFQGSSKSFRYIKYSVEGTDRLCNIAEIKLYRLKEGASFPEPDFPENLEEWTAYYEKATEGKNYSQSTKAVFDAAVSEAKALADSTDEAKRNKARKKLADAYLALAQIFVYNSFSGVDGAVIRDDNGIVIQAHGGQIQQLTVDGKTKWYWIGEDKTNDYRPCPGIHMYTSEDLYNWKDEGLVLRTAKTFDEFKTDDYFKNLYGDLKTEAEQKAIFTDIWQGSNSDEGCVIERPKMLYNDKTGKYVIWFHADGQDPFAATSGGNYAKAKAGVAIADSPTGPYKLLGSYLLNTNKWADHGFDSEGGHVRDMNLFKDDDGTAYVMYSSDGNQTMHIAKLNDEYTNVAKPQGKAVEGVDFTRNFIGQSREAPAMFKYNNKYYLVTSGCTGWAPNRASYAVADHPLGPWTTVGDPCTDEGSGTTYDTQSTCVFPVDAANGQFIYMGDRWSNPDTGNALRDSRYVWLPVEFTYDEEAGYSKMALKRHTDWTLEDEVFKRDTDRKGLGQAVSEAGKYTKDQYLAETWQVFADAYRDAKAVLADLSANQQQINQAQASLQQATSGLKTVKKLLEEGINANVIAESQKNLYTEESWGIYETILNEARAFLSQEKVSEADAKDAIKALEDAKSALQKKTNSNTGNTGNTTVKKEDQVIECEKSVAKAYGAKAFKLNARLKTGDGALSFVSSDKKVADVDQNGKVTIKGTGSCTITITAAATSKYNQASATATITVKPKKAVVSSAKAVKGKKLTVKWKKDTKATGYEIQCCLKKDFKKIAAKANVKKAKTTSATLKKLKKGKKYYVRVRAYKTAKVGGKTTKLYGDWSKAKLSGKIK